MGGGFSLASHMGHTVPVGTPRTINQIADDIIYRKRRVQQEYIAIGQGLIEAKNQMEHGEWLPWLSDTVEFSERMAQGLMAIASSPNPQALADLGLTKAMTLAALPDERRDAFLSSTHSVNGIERTVAEMSTRELKKAVASGKVSYQNPVPVVATPTKSGKVWQPIDEAHKPKCGSVVVVVERRSGHPDYYCAVVVTSGFRFAYGRYTGWAPVAPFDLET